MAMDTMEYIVHNSKCIYTGKYIGVSRDEYKLHYLTSSIIKEKSVTQISDRPPAKRFFHVNNVVDYISLGYKYSIVYTQIYSYFQFNIHRVHILLLV